MAKTRTRGQRKNTALTQPGNTVDTVDIVAQPLPQSAMSAPQMQRIRTVQKAQNAQSLIVPGMVALGCWGLAFSFTFLTNSQNHIVFGVMSALMALMWSVNLGLRVRKVLH